MTKQEDGGAAFQIPPDIFPTPGDPHGMMGTYPPADAKAAKARAAYRTQTATALLTHRRAPAKQE